MGVLPVWGRRRRKNITPTGWLGLVVQLEDDVFDLRVVFQSVNTHFSAEPTFQTWDSIKRQTPTYILVLA